MTSFPRLATGTASRDSNMYAQCGELYQSDETIRRLKTITETIDYLREQGFHAEVEMLIAAVKNAGEAVREPECYTADNASQ